MFERITHKEKILSIIIYSKFHKNGIEFFTPDDFSQQLAYMKRPKNYLIQPHTHNTVPREVNHTQEVLFIKSGKVRIDFFDDDRQYLKSRVLDAGDVILLAHGGHGIKMLETSEIIEVKQGPYTGEQDKTRFDGPDEKLMNSK
jgi:hypothetical protein